jgi:hypothetical protein
MADGSALLGSVLTVEIKRRGRNSLSQLAFREQPVCGGPTESDEPTNMGIVV